MSDQPPVPPPPPDDGAPPPPPTVGPPPPPAASPVAGRGRRRYDVMEAFRYGWAKFREQLGPILAGLAILFVGTFVVLGLGAAVVALAVRVSESGDDALRVTTILALAVLLVGLVMLMLLFQAGVIRFGLAIVDGRRLELATLLSTDRLGTVLLGSLLAALLGLVGMLLLVLPGIIFAFFAQFWLFFVLDRGEGPWTAIRSSIRFTADNLLDVLVLYAMSLLVGIVGALLFGVGMLVAFPVTVIAQAYTFRWLHGRPVAP